MATPSATIDPPPGRWRQIFQIPLPDAAVHRWHISPAIDLSAYAFSWLWVLLPLLFFGPDRHEDYLFIFMASVVLIDIHRHYGLPYVYLDRQVASRFPLRFTLFPLVMFVGFCASPYLKLMRTRLGFETLAAAAAGVLLLVQILREDQAGEPVPWRRLALAVVPAAAVAGLLTALGLGQPALIWLLAALVASFVLDWRKMVELSPPEGAEGAAGQGEGAAGQGEASRAPRFVFPLLILAAVIAAGIFGPSITTALRGGVPVRGVLSAVVVFSVAWNIWHVFMQKYGILRLYNAKNGVEGKVPGWVDRLLIFCWLPLYMAWLGPEYKALILENFKTGKKTILPALELFEAIQPVLLPLSAGLVVAALVAFVVHERRVNGLTNAPRIWMAVGTTLLSSMFLFVDPIKAYIAYGFSHAVEYMVFVWAFQRRRYQRPLAHKPLLGRVLKHPLAAYLGFVLVLAVAFFYLKYFGKFIFTDHERPKFLDYKTTTWFFYWTVYQSMVHFYFDGFLWKMRLPATRAHI